MPEIHEELSDDMDDFMIFPITDIDNNNDADDEDSGISHPFGESLMKRHQERRPSMTLRQRRYSQLGIGNGPLLKLNVNNFTEKAEPLAWPIPPNCSPGRLLWLKAMNKIRNMKDPWENFNIDSLPEEKAIRHRYHALMKRWKVDEVFVKMEKEPFNHGAMRSCYRMKKLSNFSHVTRNWSKHSHNYVAKIYMEDVAREVYFEDVRLQMDAKLWGEEYNRHNPPKKVDIFQMSILEFKDRPGKPLYHLEHFIEGDYIKYNSNSGFVDENLRLTPQAFSHFTFERSGHKLIVVDIQGVGDLWTDPQVHTCEGQDYGDGNLGARGMALFFHSHQCNSICDSLILTRFDLAPTEVANQEQFTRSLPMKISAATVVRGREEMVVSASPRERLDLTLFLARQRSRTMSTCSEVSERSGDTDDMSSHFSEDEPMMIPGSPMGQPMEISPIRGRRIRFLSESDDSASATLTEEEDRIRFQRSLTRGARPSCVSHEINLRNLEDFRKMEDSILGQIHHELAKYHEMGRFGESAIDIEAALYHEQHAADLGVKEAILTMAYLYLDLPHDILFNCHVEQSDDNTIQGVDYMIMAADVGDRSAMIYMAGAFENGVGLGSNRSKSYKEAMRWYKLAVETTKQDESGEFDAAMNNPIYQLQAKMAEMYLEGGHGLDRDPSSSGDYYTEAADGAMASMKGRLANKYYGLAEEAYAQVEEE